MIVKVKGGYVVMSKKGKRLSKPASREATLKRMGQIEWFKRNKQYAYLSTHTHTEGDVTLDVDKLVERVGHRKTSKFPLRLLKIDKSTKSGFSPITRLPFADVKKPLILHDGKLIDGRHRAVKLEAAGKRLVNVIHATTKDIQAVRVSGTPNNAQHAHYGTSKRAKTEQPMSVWSKPKPQPQPMGQVKVEYANLVSMEVIQP